MIRRGDPDTFRRRTAGRRTEPRDFLRRLISSDDN
jgi:hypothetical protein